MIIYGINPVLEALKAGRVARLRVGPRHDGRLQQVLTLAASQQVPIDRVDQQTLDRVSRNGVHQGIVAEVAPARDLSVEELVRDIVGPPLLVVLDGIEDPHNVGAIVRTVDAAGAHGVVRQTRRAAALDAAAAKASAGAVAHVPIVDVVNIARAIEELKSLNVWTIGLAGDAAQSYDAVDFTQPTAIVLGAEGSGLRRLVRESCDLTASIPMRGHVESLNVSVAAGVVLFEAARQRRSHSIAQRPPTT
jgi:23S rRNA (guanosine2251-2'-O)-methyltransferase